MAEHRWHFNASGTSLVRSFLLALALFAGTLALGMQTPPGESTDLLEQVGEVVSPLQDIHPLGLLIIIFLNNSIKSFAAMLLGIFLGLPPFLFIVLNGLVIGVLISGLVETAGYTVVVASLAPHGVIEIPLVLVSSAIGFMLGLESLRWLTGRESQLKARLTNGLKIYLRWILPGLALAAAIEVYLTPLIVRVIEGS